MCTMNTTIKLTSVFSLYSKYSQTKPLLSAWQTRCPNLNPINSKSIFLILYVLCTFHLTLTFRMKITSLWKPSLPRTQNVGSHLIFMNLFVEVFNFFTEQTFACQNKQKPTKWEQAKAIYLELAIAGESATVTWFWQRLKGRLRSGKAV